MLAQIQFSQGNIEEAKRHAQYQLQISEQIKSRPFMEDSHERLGEIALCQQNWDKAISHWQKLESSEAHGYFGYSDCMVGYVYMKKVDSCRALEYFKRALDKTVHSPTNIVGLLYVLLRTLLGLEVACQKAPEQFIALCNDFKKRHADALKTVPLGQWHLESAKPSEQFSHLTFADNFDQEPIHPLWRWMDEFKDCAYKKVKPHGVEISAANWRDFDGLNVSAPRFMREIAGDFASEICVLPASDDKPMMGGLLVWQDKDNFLRFDIGSLGPDEVRLYGYINGEQQIVGRGLLHRQTLQTTYLRLERSGDEFSAYCSEDGERWFTCGMVTLPLEDPIKIGIHAIGMIDRTIYCGAYKEGTATVFRGFKLWTR